MNPSDFEMQFLLSWDASNVVLLLRNLSQDVGSWKEWLNSDFIFNIVHLNIETIKATDLRIKSNASSASVWELEILRNNLCYFSKPTHGEVPEDHRDQRLHPTRMMLAMRHVTREVEVLGLRQVLGQGHSKYDRLYFITLGNR